MEGIDKNFMKEKRKMKVIVEWEKGMGRWGVKKKGKERELEKIIEKREGIWFGGIMKYKEKGRGDEEERWIREEREMIEEDGIEWEKI